MEKICIARRRIGDRDAIRPAGAEFHVTAPAPAQDRDEEIVSFSMTSDQWRRIQPNGAVSADLSPGGPGRQEGRIVFHLHVKKTEPVRMLKPEQVCLMLQIGKGSLAGLIRSGDLKTYRIGRMRRFLFSDIMDYLIRCEESRAGGINAGSQAGHENGRKALQSARLRVHGETARG